VLGIGARIELVVVEKRFRIERNDPRRCDCNDDERDNERAGDHRDLLSLELAPELRPRRPHPLVGNECRSDGQCGHV